METVPEPADREVTVVAKPLKQLEVVEWRRKVVALLEQGMTQREAAKELGISPSRVSQLVASAISRAEYGAVAEYRVMQLQKLDRLMAKLDRVLDAKHVVVSQGRVMRPQRWDEKRERWVEDPEAEPYEDTGPIISAITAYRGLLERGARLTGADAPQRAEIAAAVSITINGVDPSSLV